MSSKKKVAKTYHIPSGVGSFKSVVPLATSSSASFCYSDSSEFGSFYGGTSTEKAFELSKSDDSVHALSLSGLTADHPPQNNLPPQSFLNSSNKLASFAAQGFRRLRTTSSDDFTLSASESGSYSDGDSPKKKKKVTTNAFSTRKIDGIAATSPRVSVADFFMPLPPDQADDAKENQADTAMDYSLSNDESTEIIGENVKIVLHLRDLDEDQTKILIFEYFGSMDNYLDVNSRASTPITGSTFKVSGQDLIYIEETNDMKELGFQDLPVVKLRRAVQEIKQWREQAGGMIPDEVVQFILSRGSNTGTSKASDNSNQRSMSTMMNAMGLSIPSPITTARAKSSTSSKNSAVAATATDQITQEPDQPIMSSEQVLIMLCKKKFEENGVPLSAALFNDASLDASSKDCPRADDPTVLAFQFRYSNDSPWMTTISVVRENQQFAELIKFMCRTFGACYRGKAAEVTGGHGHNSLNNSNSCPLKHEELGALFRLLLDCLQCNKSDTAMIALIFKTLAPVAPLLGERAHALLMGDDVTTILSIMTMHKSDPTIMAQILQTLQYFLRGKPVKMILFDGGIADLCLDILVMHKNSMSLVKQVIDAIKLLATSESNQLQFSNSKTCSTLLDILKTYKLNGSMVKYICRVIWNISMPKPTKALMKEAGCCELLFEIVTLHQHNPTTIDPILGAIWTLSLLPANQESLGSLGICELLVQLVKTHRQNVKIVDHALGAITNLATHVNNHQKLVTNGVCDCLIDVLALHLKEHSIAETAGGAMGSIIENDKQGNTVFANSSVGCDLLISALKEHIKVPAAVRQICSAVKGKLTVSATSASHNDNAFRELGLNGLLVDALKAHCISVPNVADGAVVPPPGMQVMKPVLSVMKSLVQRQENCIQIIVAQGIQTLQQCLGFFCSFADISTIMDLLDLLDGLISCLPATTHHSSSTKKSRAISPSLMPPTSLSPDQFRLIVFNTVLDVISVFNVQEDVVIRCLMILRDSDVTPATLIQATKGAAVILVLLELLPLHKTCERIINPICWVIIKMGPAALKQVDLLSLKFPQTMLSLLNTHIENVECVLHLTWLISNTCHHRMEVAKNFLEESVTQEQSMGGFITFPASMEPPAPKVKLMSLLCKAVTQHHFANAPALKYICHVLMEITSHSALIIQNPHLLDKKALFSILETLFPAYYERKLVMYPLCGIVKNMLAADITSIIWVTKLQLNPIFQNARKFFETEDPKLATEIDYLISALDLAGGM